MEVHAVKVTLLGTSPPVWRRILVPRDITLGNLHRTLQTVMGWTNCHLHQFGRQRQRMTDPRSRVGTKAADENRTKLGERNRFSRFVWRVNDVVHPKTVVGRKDLQRFSKQSRMPITLITRKPVSGSAILCLNPSLQTKLIDDCAVENFDAGTSQRELAVPRVSLGDRGHHWKILASAEQDSCCYSLFSTSLTKSASSRVRNPLRTTKSQREIGSDKPCSRHLSGSRRKIHAK